MFKKKLIANRGEIALTIIRSCREMGIKTVAVYSTADKESLHIRFADEAVCIGPPASRFSYLNIPNIIAAAEITNADAIHPGYGFMSENAEFSQICEDYHIKFIGASPKMIKAMGDKATAKETMKKAGVPIIPGSDGLVDTIAEAREIAQSIGYPVIIKATAGGGGKGMRVIKEPDDFEKAWNAAKMEAKNAFGNDGLYIEKFIEDPHHVEIQIMGDRHGTVVHMSERDCSIQRRHQKLLEETPSPIITSEIREKMGHAAIKGASAIGYEGAGTIEFLSDNKGNFYFMEMNTRIQVEHPITEQVTDQDLVAMQIQVAAGKMIPKESHFPRRHSMECRINAEDPYNDFRPSPGKITTCHFPGGRGVRVDSHIYTGYTIPPNYDSMIAKLVVTASTRERVLMRMKRSLEEFVIEGIHTTIPFHLKLMDNKDFRRGDYTTKFIEKFRFK